MHHVERDGGWFKLERKRLFRAALACRAQLISLGPTKTTLEVTAEDLTTARRLVRELVALVEGAPPALSNVPGRADDAELDRLLDGGGGSDPAGP